jgi:hypothetical protein
MGESKFGMNAPDKPVGGLPDFMALCAIQQKRAERASRLPPKSAKNS